MQTSLFGLISGHPRYFIIALGLLMSSIGTGLTQVAVFGTLSKLGASALEFSIAYALTIMPGLFASSLSDYFSRKINWGLLLIVSQFVGAFSLLLPIYGLQTQSKWLILSAEFVGAALSGFIFPISQSILKRTFAENEMGLMVKLDSALFSVNVVLGIGLGSLLYDRMSSFSYLSIDLVSYLVSGILIWIACAGHFKNFLPENSFYLNSKDVYFSIKTLNQKQWLAFLLLPMLSLIATPAMALLPVLASRFGHSFEISGLTFTPAVVFLLSRSLGQLLGPWLVPSQRFTTLAKNTSLFWLCTAVFIGFYALAGIVMNPWMACALVVCAHISSNMIYVVGSFSLQNAFSAAEMGTASARVYQLQLVIMTIMSLLAGVISSTFGPMFALFIGLVPALCIFILRRSFILRNGQSR